MSDEISNEELLSMVLRLRIENEVNKVLISGLKQSLLYHKNEEIDECIRAVNGISDMTAIQIMQSWSEAEAIFFKDLINDEIRNLSLLYKS